MFTWINEFTSKYSNRAVTCIFYDWNLWRHNFTYPFICFKLHNAVPAKIISEIFLKQLIEPFSYACKNIPLLLIVDECIAFEVDSIGRSKNSWKSFFNIRQVLFKFSITTSSDLHQTFYIKVLSVSMTIMLSN